MGSLAVTSAHALMDRNNWMVMREQATVLVDSGMLPSTVRKPEAAIAIMMKGLELGMPPMQAFAHITIIQGKPTLSPEGMMALIYKNHPQAIIDFVKIEDEICEIQAARHPKSMKTTFKFTRADAEQAKLWAKENWQKYPRAMCRSRCVAEMARSIFPDAIAGCSYTTEEIEPEAVLQEDGSFQVKDKPKQQQAQEAIIIEPEKMTLWSHAVHWKWALKQLSLKGDENYLDLLAKEFEGKEFPEAAADYMPILKKIHHDAKNSGLARDYQKQEEAKKEEIKAEHGVDFNTEKEG